MMLLLPALYESLTAALRRAAELLGPEDVFELEHGTALQDWDKVRTDRLTFHEEPSRPVLHESVSGN